MKLLILALFLNSCAFSQKVKDCSQLSTLINFEQVLKNFRISGNSDSLVLIDKNEVVPHGCLNFKWGNCYVKLTHDSSLIKRAIKGSSFLYFKGECKYFVLDNFKKKGHSYSFTIYRACSNEFMDCIVLFEQGKYNLFWFSGGEY